MIDHTTAKPARRRVLAAAVLALLGTSGALHAQQYPSVSPTAEIDATPRTVEALGFQRTATADSTASGPAGALPGSGVPFPAGRVTLPALPPPSVPQPVPDEEPVEPVQPPVVNPLPEVQPPVVNCQLLVPGQTILQNEVQVRDVSGAAGSSRVYSFAVPKGATNLRFLTAGGTGDVTVYASPCRVPTESTYEQKSDRPGNNETVLWETPAPTELTIYHFLVVGKRDFARVTVRASYTLVQETMW